jgi:hypothetical protein
MDENDLTGNLQAMLLFIEAHIADEIPDRGTLDPYGILLKWESGGVRMVFLETMDDSDLVLKGMPGPQMARRIEDMIRHYRDDYSVVSAGLVMDAHVRPQEGGEGTDAVIAWLDDRGKQRVRVVMSYSLRGREFKITSKTIETREKLFLPAE